MPARQNNFKAALREMRLQKGVWCTMQDPMGAEMLADCGYDWMLFDTEHSPTDLASVPGLLQAVAPYDTVPIVRPSSLDPVAIKKLLDFGAQTLLVPYVQTPEEAALAVASVTYPPEGIRGVAGMTRASGFGRNADYHATAREEICILIQIETVAAMERLDEIAAVPRLDGIFIGPADLGASMGYIAERNHPDVQNAVIDGIKRIRACGLPPGVLALDPKFAQDCTDAGAVFVSQDLDMLAMRKGLSIS